MAHRTSSLWRNLRTYQIYGANTDVGKTIVSTILCNALRKKYPLENVYYLKPVSTGPLTSADDRHISRHALGTQTKTLFQFDQAVSPHIAARQLDPEFQGEKHSYIYPLSDDTVLSGVQEHIAACAASGPGTLFLETAGGVNSPSPSGSLQADLYRPLRLPICLVADHRLGGISATISAFESLHLRGYDVDAVFIFQGDYQNGEYLEEYFRKRNVSCFDLPSPPKREQSTNEEDDGRRLDAYYTQMKHDASLSKKAVDSWVEHLRYKHNKRIADLEKMAGRASKQIWYPFTQHHGLSRKNILTIDSASGDFFQTTLVPPIDRRVNTGLLSSTFDGSASWWTQGLGHGNPDLSLEAAYAAGRYGHVMFAGAVHEPAIKLASNLLKNLKNPRLGRVFYSDNGSTGMEVAIKMALTASSKRYNWDVKKGQVAVLGLKGSYHGDTIGAMDASEPSIFNEKVHWYKGNGHWFDFPKVKMIKGRWIVEPPQGMEEISGKRTEFESLTQIFDLTSRRESQMANNYKQYLQRTLSRLVETEGRTFGAVVMEPVILGAGGMLFVDPLFQHCLVEVVRGSSHLFSTRGKRSKKLKKAKEAITKDPEEEDPRVWTGLPIVFDEVFTGIYRLGRFSSSSFLQVHPDISCHAKLLTGGLVPLCATLASNSIYQAFLNPEKKEALLHGHSYTAHAVGCHVANTSLKIMEEMHGSGNWNQYINDWRDGPERDDHANRELTAWSVWSKSFVERVSRSREVESVIALGSVLAINLQDDKQAGYNSSAATGLQKTLLNGPKDFQIHSRVLGNVFYLMASQISKQEDLMRIEKLLLEALAKEARKIRVY